MEKMAWGREFESILHLFEGPSWAIKGAQLCAAWRARPGPVRRHWKSELSNAGDGEHPRVPGKDWLFISGNDREERMSSD